MAKPNKARKQFEVWAIARIEQLQQVLLMQDHVFELVYVDEFEKPTILFQVPDNYPYKTIRIRYSQFALDEWKAGRKDILLHGLAHEICHPLIEPLYNAGFVRFVTKDAILNECERLTDHIANIVFKAGLIQ